MFKLVSQYEPSGDQPKAIGQLVDGIKKGMRGQTLLGVTGSVESVIRTLNIRLSVAHESYNLKVPVRILFVDERDSGSFVPLLGRSELFDRFRITFDQKKPRIILKHENE